VKRLPVVDPAGLLLGIAGTVLCDCLVLTRQMLNAPIPAEMFIMPVDG
jgi:hypothetical protein